MWKNYENKLTMYEGLLSVMKENDGIVQSVSAFSDSASGFETAVNEIKAKSIEVDKASVGKTAAKHDAEDALIESLLGVCSILYIFGKKQKNNEIAERSDVTETVLLRMRDTDLASFGTDIAGMAESYSAELEALGMTAAKIADLRTKADAFGAAIGSRESGVANRIGSREAMKDLFARADDIICDELDRFIELFRQDNPEFFDKYQAARNIRDIGIRHRPAEESVGTSV